jgi:hypothetical protein
VVSEDLESIIRRYIILGKVSPQGFETVKCAKCNDYKTRGGFKFEAGGFGYSCFNCGAKARYDPEKRNLSAAMREILISFGVPDSEIERCVSLSFFKEKKIATSADPVKKHLELPTTEAPLPALSVLITTDDSPWCEVAREYLKSRGISSNDTPFYVSDNEKWVGRVIIPYIFREKIIYWQARSMDELITPRYKNPSVEKENIFFNMDEIYRYTDEPLFVTEGPLDALSIGKNAVALLGSTLSEFRERELKKVASRRKVIFVIDKNLNGYKLGQKILKQESLQWYIACFPDNVDDSNHALQMYGQLWMVNHITTTAVKGFSGRTLLEVRCDR